MPKPLGKHSKAVGSVIAILFIVGAIVIAFALIEFGLSAQQRQAEIQQKTYEAQAKATDIVKSVNSVWFFDESTSTLTINVTNNYAEPITITGITVLYESGTYEILKGDLSKILGVRFIKGQSTLPYTLMPGETLSIVYETLGGEKPVSVRVAIVTYQVVAASSAKQYILSNITVMPTYKVVLAPTMFKEGTVTTKGYDLEAYQVSPSDITTYKGTSEGNLAHISNPNDGLVYNVTSVKEERTNWLAGWNYRRPITITNTLAQTLTDYQVRIELNSTNFDFAQAQPNGSDIRFTLSDGVTKIPYWIQEWDSVNQKAIIWVKVPQIPANGKTIIYMYYGNSEAVSESNGDSVFIFFDDFKGTELNTTKWKVVEQTPTIQDSQCIIVGGDKVEAIRTLESFTPPFIVHYKLKPLGFLGIYGDWDAGIAIGKNKKKLLGFVDDVFDYDPPEEENNELTIMNLWWKDIISSSDSRANYEYHEYEVIVLEDDSIFKDLTDERVVESDNSKTGYIWLINDGDNIPPPPPLPPIPIPPSDSSYDWIFVRKYASEEPAVSIGPKEDIFKHVSQVNVKFANVPNNVMLEFTIKLKFNVSNVNVKFYLWNGSGWDFVKSAIVGVVYSEISFSTLAVSKYVVNGVTSLSVNVTHNVPFKEFIDYVGLKVYTPTKTVIYIGVGGNNSIYKYILDTGQFDSEVIRAEYAGAPIVFNGNVSMDYDVHRNLLWVINGSNLYYYNVTERQWHLYDSSLPESAGEGCSLIYLDNRIYVFIGGGSSNLYIYDLSVWGSSPSSPYNLGFEIGAYSVAETDGKYIYILTGGGTIKFYRIDPSNPETPLPLNDSPTAYAVGLAYDEDRNRLWLIGKGGGIYYYDIVNDVWKPYQQQIPYTPQSQGNRLEYYNGKLYHVRDDYTRELWIIDVSK